MSDWNGKWNYKAIFVGNIDEKRKKRFLIAQKKEVFNVFTLEKTKFFNDIVDVVINVAKKFLRDLGFAEINITHDQILVLNENEFNKKVLMHKYDSGKCHLGYVYLINKDDLVRVIHALTHEIAHLISFYIIRYKDIGNNNVHVNHASGFCSLRSDDEKGHYNSLDEAATEFVANELRRKFVKINDILVNEDKVRLCNSYTYFKEVAFLRALLSLHSNSGLNKETLFKSYIDGNSNFCDKLKSIYPDTYHVYKEINTKQYCDLQKIAFKLGKKDLENVFIKNLNEFKVREG